MRTTKILHTTLKEYNYTLLTFFPYLNTLDPQDSITSFIFNHDHICLLLRLGVHTSVHGHSSRTKKISSQIIEPKELHSFDRHQIMFKDHKSAYQNESVEENP